MHPDKIQGENPGKDEKVDSSKCNAPDIYPCESGKCFKYRVMQLNASYATQREQPTEKTNKINYFRAKHAFPSVFF